MKKRLSKIACALLALSLCLQAGLMVSASSNTSIDQIAKQTLTVYCGIDEQGVETICYENVQKFKTELYMAFPDMSDLDIAKSILLYTGNTSEEVNQLEDEYILEALTYGERIYSDSYIKTDENGNQTIISRNEMFEEIISATPATGIAPMSSWTSSDGYMRLTTTASSTTGSVSGRKYYILETTGKWLKTPLNKGEDILAIGTDGVFDNTYNYYGQYVQSIQCKTSYGICDNKTWTYTVSKNAGSNSSNIKFEFDTSGNGGMALRFKLFSYTCPLSGSLAHRISYPTMEAKLRFKVSLYNVDSDVRPYYCHKQVGVGSVGVGFSQSGASISFSFAGTKAVYAAEPLAIRG